MQILNRFFIAIENGMSNEINIHVLAHSFRDFVLFFFSISSIYDFYFRLFKIHFKLTQLAIYRACK